MKNNKIGKIDIAELNVPPEKHEYETAKYFAGVFRTVKGGEIWWCAVGENVGVEINGKNEEFSRPVLVLKKLSKYGFMGIPLTSQEHVGSWYVEFVFQDKKQTAVLAQARVISVFRLYKKMGTVPNSDLEMVKRGFRKLYF